jgi:hypothetical protein
MVKQYNSTNNYTDLIGAYSNFYNSHAVTLGNVQFRYIYIRNDPTYNLSIKEIECWINNSNVASSGTPYSTRETYTRYTDTSETTLSNSIDGNTSTSMTLTDSTYGSYLLKLNQNYNLSDLQRIIVFNNGGADYSSGVNSIQLLDENKKIISWVDHSSGQTLTNTSSISYINYIGAKDDVINDVSYNIYTSNNLNYVFANYYNNTFVGDTGIVSQGNLTVSGNQHLVGELYMTGKLRLEREDNPQNAERTWMIYTDDSSSNHLTFDWYQVDTNNEPNFDNVTATNGRVMQLATSAIFLNEDTKVTGELNVGIENSTTNKPTHSTLFVNGSVDSYSQRSWGKPLLSLQWGDSTDTNIGQWGFGQGGLTENTGNSSETSTLAIGPTGTSTNWGFSPKIFITTDGNLGIGTNAPSEKLNVNGTAYISGMTTIGEKININDGGSHSNRKISLYDNSDTYSMGTQPYVFYFRTASNFLWYKGGSHSSSSYDAGTSGDTLMRLNSTGLGIGTNPSYKLQVDGTTYISSDTTIGGELEIKADDDTSQKDLKIFNGDLYIQNDKTSSSGTGVPHIHFGENRDYTKHMSIFYDGDNNSGDNNSGDNNYIGFENGAEEFIMSVTTAGKVGIGVTYPGQTLEVVGDSKITLTKSSTSTTSSVTGDDEYYPLVLKNNTSKVGYYSNQGVMYGLLKLDSGSGEWLFGTQAHTNDGAGWAGSGEQEGDLYITTATMHSGGEFQYGGWISRNSNEQGLNFTGKHRLYTFNNELYNEKYYGYIVSSAGKMKTLNGEFQNNIKNINISQSLPNVELSIKKNDKKVIGVISDGEAFDDSSRKYKLGVWGSFSSKENHDQRVDVNSLGEGALWVSDIYGPLENGDYITSSDIPGIGGKQDDDLLHNYTVAKITMDCDFHPQLEPLRKIQTDASGISILDENHNPLYENCLDASGNIQYVYEYEMKYIDIEGNILSKEVYETRKSDGENVYKMAFVACTYHCG